ncbi:MAG: dihydrolipoamide acetyltransferase family protein [Caldibacillus sp.]
MAVEQIVMPQLGESVTEGTIIKWLVTPGEKVNKYQPLAEVLTDKVTAEVPSSYSGIVKELLVEEGQTVPVGTVICSITTIEIGKKEVNQLQADEPKVMLRENVDMKTRFSPVVLRLAREHGIDLSKIKGTGRGGRITRKDILKYIKAEEERKESEMTMSLTEVEPPQSVQAFSTEDRMREIPVTPVRRAIAHNMVRSKQEIPHAWMMVEVDVTELVKYREQIKDAFLKKEGFPLTYFAFFVKACAQALKEYPILNSEWQGEKIIQKKDINISIAVASENELFVPVIKNADEKSIKGIAREIYELANKARSGQLRPEDVQGGTFTVNNTGSFGSVQSMGIINYPQAAILQVEAIVKRPVVINNGIFIRDIVNLCLSIDHRVLDGLISGRFLQRLKEILENMREETITIY